MIMMMIISRTDFFTEKCRGGLGQVPGEEPGSECGELSF